MPRIRTIKPEFFRHEGLQDLEAANPTNHVMLVFAGLWGHCDKAGVFRWQPRQLKLDILPFLNFDLAKTLGLLQDAGFIIRYEVDKKQYGIIPTFREHQRLSGKESQEPPRYPGPSGKTTGSNSEAPGKQQGSARDQPESQEGKGRESVCDSDSPDSGSLDASDSLPRDCNGHANGEQPTPEPEPTNGTSGFVEFMMIFPRADDRPLASRAWLRATLERKIPTPVLIRRAHAYAHDRDGKPAQFTQKAKNWLDAQEPDKPEVRLTPDEITRLHFVVERTASDPDQKWSLHDLNLTSEDIELLIKAGECSNSPYPSTQTRKLASLRLS